MEGKRYMGGIQTLKGIEKRGEGRGSCFSQGNSGRIRSGDKEGKKAPR